MSERTAEETRNFTLDNIEETREQVRSVLQNRPVDDKGRPIIVEGTVDDVSMLDDETLGMYVRTEEGLFECRLPLTDDAQRRSDAVTAIQERTDATVTEPMSLIGERMWIAHNQNGNFFAFPPTRTQRWGRETPLYHPKESSGDEPVFGMVSEAAIPILLLSGVGVPAAFFAGLPFVSAISIAVFLITVFVIKRMSQRSEESSTLEAERVTEEPRP